MKLKEILQLIDTENIKQHVNTFNIIVQSFGASMDSLTSEMSKDIEKSNENSKIREVKNRENLEKVWGKKKWDVRFVKCLIKIQVNSEPGKSKFVDFAVFCAIISLGMVIT